MKTLLHRLLVAVITLALGGVALAKSASSASAEKARLAIQVLKTNSPPADKAAACKRLAIYGDAKAVPALAPLLADAELASWARIALEAIPGRAADRALRDAAGKLNGRLLVGAINSIGVRRDAGAVGLLARKLKEADAEVASAAAVALGRIGGSKATSALSAALGDTRPEVRSAVAQGLILAAEKLLAARQAAKAAKLYEQVRTAPVPVQRIAEATRGVILARGEAGLPLLIETLRSSDKTLVAIALRTARELPGAATTRALAAELTSGPASHQSKLLHVLADRNDAAAWAAVFAVARTGATDLRLVAVEVMGTSGNADCAPVLLELLATPDASVAQAARAALAGWSGPDVNAPITARLKNATGPARRALIEIVGQRRLAASVPELVQAARDEDHGVRAAAIKALGQTVEARQLKDLTALLAKPRAADDRELIQAALEAAGERLPDKAKSTAELLALWPGSAPAVQCALLPVLAVLGTDPALETVRGALTSSEAGVRDAAIRALADWPAPAAIPALRQLLKESADETHRFLALRGCARLLDADKSTPADRLKIFAELLAGTPRTDDRKLLLSGLAKVGDAGSLKLIEPFLGTAEVQAEAELAYVQVAGAIRKAAPAEAEAAAKRAVADFKSEAAREQARKILNR
jgi:HEAT repeat protein